MFEKYLGDIKTYYQSGNHLNILIDKVFRKQVPIIRYFRGIKGVIKKLPPCY